MANINAQFNYSANFGPVIGQMQKLTAEANLLNNTLQNLDKQAVGLKTSLASSFASDLGKIGGWNAKMVELTDSVDQFGQSLLKQKLTLREYAQEAIGAFSKSSNAHKLAVREVAREMSQLVTLGKDMNGKQMGMMITPATINLKDFNTQMAVSQKQWSIFNTLVQDGATHLINFGKNTQWAGRQITVGLTVPLTIYGNMVSKVFREVDAELTRFQKVYGTGLMQSSSDATKQMVGDVRSIAIEFSKSFGIAAKETASLAADLAATGLEGQKLLTSLRETTRLAVLGDISNQDAMKTTLSLQNAFKMNTDELAQSVNFLNAVENQTSLSLQDLTTAIPKAGPVVKALGGDVKDLSLLMVALKEGGISAAEGANALKSGMASLVNPTKQASQTAKQYGIDINAIVQANRGQLMPTIIAFQQQLQLLDDFGKAQVIENVFGKYQFARISALFDNLNASASQTNAVLGLMGKSNKELAATAYQEMDTLMNSASRRFQRATESIKAQFITIGGSITESIIPIIESLSNKIGKAIEFFQNLPKPIKSFIKVAVGLTAIAGPIIMMVGIFSNFLGYVGKGAMGMVNLGRHMAGLPTQKFEMLSDTQIMASKATQQLSNSFDIERSSVERLNQALGLYRKNLVEAINLNPAFLNRQTSAITTTGKPPTVKLQGGGSAWVPGSGNGDKVPAMLEPGEYVVNKKAAAEYGSTLDQINYQSAPRFQNGGRMPGYADQSFIGPKPQISYDLQGTYRPGGYTPFANYPFASKESAESFQSTDPRKWGGSGSRITRDINDPQQKAYADWIAGHNSNQFRTGTGIMKRMDMAGHRDQMLNSMSPISQSIPLYRGTVLKEKGANEFSGVGARELLMYIKHGMFDKAIGKKIQWSDMQSFSSNPNIASYNKFIESWTKPSNTNSKKAADRQLASMDMLPVIFRLASAKGQKGFNISDKAMVQEVMGKPVNEKEWVLNSPSGTISGIRQDIGTKNYIIDLMQNGGRVQSHAEESYRQPFQKTDKEYETVYKWIGGELDYFRKRKNVKGRWTDSEKYDAERYQELLSVMRSVPEGTKMMRGSILNPGMSGEMSKETQLAMLTAIQTGDYGSLYGMDISFNDFASFASDVMGPEYGPRGIKGGVSRFSRVAYNKLYRPVHSRETESGRFFDDYERKKATGKESRYGSSPVMYDLTAGPNTQGRDISMGDPSTGAPYPKYRDSWVSDVPDGINEILTHGVQGTITGVSSDLQSRQPIIHIQGKQSGGRINGYAGASARFGGTVPSGYAFAHIVNPIRSGQGLVTLPFGLSIPAKINSRLAQNKDVNPKELSKFFMADIAEERMAQALGIYGEKDPSGIAQKIQYSIANKVGMLKGKIGDQDVYNQAKNIPEIKSRFKKYLESGKLYDARSRISDEGLVRSGWKQILDKNGEITGYTKDGKKILREKRSSYVAYKDPKTKKSLGYSSGTDTINSKDPFTKDKMSWLEQSYLGMQSGGRLNGYATETTSWAKKAAAPKAYAGVLQGIPSWATRPDEYEAIVSALRAAGIPESDRLASFYIQDVLAHINPSTTNANGVYEKVWAAANLMKDSQVYNVFLETLNSRKDIGGLLNPSTVSRVAAASGLPVTTVQTELTKIADGVHPNTANGAKVMMTLARMFPSRTSPGMPIAVAAGLEARLQGNFYDTLGQRALPSNLPNTTVRAYDPRGNGAPTSSGQGSRVRSTGLIMPSGAMRPSIVMPNIQSIPSAAGGTGTSATVKVDANGNVLSNGIDDMVAHTVTGKPIAVSSKELLAIGPSGGIAGVTSPGDEARGKIVHPMGTALMRGKNFQQIRSAAGGMTESIYDQQISGGSMGQFGGSAFMMISVMQQMSFAINQFTTDAQNGGGKFVAAMNLALTTTQMMGNGVGDVLTGMSNSRKQNLDLISGLDVAGPKLDNRGKEMTGMSSGIGKALGVAGKGMSMLGSLPVQIGLQVGIMAVTKSVEMYQAAMEKAKKAGKSAFVEPTETAKLLGIQVKSLTESTEAYSKLASTIYGAQGKGAYDKTFADTINKDYKDLIVTLKDAKNQQMQINKLTQVYSSLVMRGVDLKSAKEITAEIARQAEAISAFNGAVGQFNAIKDAATASDALSKSIVTNIQLIKDWQKETSAMNDTQVAASEGEFIVALVKDFFTGKKVNNEIAALLTGGLKEAFSIAANDPVAANEATKMIVSQFKNVDKNALKTELTGFLSDFGIGQFSKTFQFVDSGSFQKLTEDTQNAILLAIQTGNGTVLEQMLNDGNLTEDEINKLNQLSLQAEAIMQIKAKIDFEEKTNIDNLNKLKDAVQAEMQIAIDAQQAKIDAEDKRHTKAMDNLSKESDRLNEKKRILQENTDYYLKELQREKQAEDYYAGQRDTALQGLSAISQGDVFGFIGAQMKAASASDQFGRDRSLASVQETSDAEQAKIDAALRGIEARNKAEDARHIKEIDNINAETAALQKQQNVTSGLIDAAVKSAQAVIDMQAGIIPSDQKTLDAAIKKADVDYKAAIQAGADISKLVPQNLNADSQKAFDKARLETKNVVTTMQNDITSAMDYVSTKSGTLSETSKKLFDDIAKSLDISPQVKIFTTAIQNVALALENFQPSIGGVGKAGTSSAQTSPSAHTSQTGAVTKATGGYISGSGTGTSDSIPARLSDGEYVVQAGAVEKYGSVMLDSINTEKFAEGGPVGDYSRVSYRGKTFNGRTAKMLQLAESKYGSGFNFYQGSYSQGIKASMGTHDGGGAVDIVPPADIDKALKALSVAGFWAKWRGSMKPPHIHALAIGDKELSNSARRQLGLPADKSYKNKSYNKKENVLSSKDSVEPIATLNKNAPLGASIASMKSPMISRILEMFQIGPSAESFADGGGVFGPGSSTSDSIPAMLSNGEYVVNAASVKKYGVGTMDSINAGKFSGGGFIGSSPPSAPRYNVPSASGGMDVQPIAQMARGGMMSGSANDNSSSYNFNFNGAGMDMVMSHVNKAVGGRINSNSRRIG
jgi:TP901 family phage tail tape measure protein